MNILDVLVTVQLMIKGAIMKATRCILLSIIFSISSLIATQEWQVVSKNGSIITLQHYYAYEVDSQLLHQIKEIFLQSFTAAYKDIPLEVLGINNLDDFLHEAFVDEEEAIKRCDQRDHFVIVAYNNGTLAGFASFNAEENHSYYIRQLSVSPVFQGAGIGQYLVMSCKKHDEQVAVLRLLARRVNNVARKFYTEKLNFIETSY
jgi:ribosomal protein S18 acetylase RimI-like enzyme